ncbi:MAG: chondroitin 4-sulfotransferase 11 [Porticoccus sp.]|jgi:chondroitin 4-sulfotransferase 11
MCLENIKKQIHSISQYHFIEDGEGVVNLNYIGRFESLNQDMNEVAGHLSRSLIDTPLRVINASDREPPYRDYYNNETKGIVADMYARDIELFDYCF